MIPQPDQPYAATLEDLVTELSATAARYGLDRFWRNARTHTLHDPLDYKLRDIGNWALHGQWPTPSFYS
jgi:hypothetical protein